MVDGSCLNSNSALAQDNLKRMLHHIKKASAVSSAQWKLLSNCFSQRSNSNTINPNDSIVHSRAYRDEQIRGWYNISSNWANEDGVMAAS